MKFCPDTEVSRDTVFARSPSASRAWLRLVLRLHVCLRARLCGCSSQQNGLLVQVSTELLQHLQPGLALWAPGRRLMERDPVGSIAPPPLPFSLPSP